jgi:hypothetical protein
MLVQVIITAQSLGYDKMHDQSYTLIFKKLYKPKGKPPPFAADTFATLSAGSGFAAEGMRREPAE